MSRALTIKALPYSHKVYVRKCSEADGEKWLSRHGHEGALVDYRAIMHARGDCAKVFVWLGPQSGIPDAVHEFIHAATWILKDSGVPVTWTNDEALCYLAERLLISYLAALEKKTRAEMRAIVGY